MKHISKFESKFNSQSGIDSYDPSVLELYNEFKSKFRTTDAFLISIFDKVQHEFDTNGSLKIYQLSYRNATGYSETIPFIGLYRGYGVTHAKVRAAIHDNSIEYITIASPYDSKFVTSTTITEENIDKRLLSLEKTVNKWRNIV